MGVTYVWWGVGMDEIVYEGAYVYGEYRECGGVCQWYSVCDGVVSVSIHLGGEYGLVVELEGLVWAYVVWSMLQIYYLARSRQFVSGYALSMLSVAEIQVLIHKLIPHIVLVHLFLVFI